MAQRAFQKSQGSGTPPEQAKLCPTAGEVFPDGAMLELLRDPSDSGPLVLLHWGRERSEIAREFTIAGLRYVPIEMEAPHLWQMRLPSKPKSYGSTEQLFSEVRDLLTKYSELSQDAVSLLTHFVFASFFINCVRIAPCLLLSGARAEAIALLRMLSWVCRHPILSADIGLCAFPGGLKPTRLICQPGAKIEKLLAPLQLSGFGISSNGSLREICSATALYLCGEELQTSFADGCLRIPIAPSRTLLSVSDEQREGDAIASLQSKLLSYRVTNFAKVRSSDFDMAEFSGPTRELARALGACIVDAPDLNRRLLEILRPYDAAARSSRTTTIACILLEALLMFCHERRESVHVGEVAKIANEILSRRGEALTMNPRETGAKLKSLGFLTTRVDAGGRGLYLLQEDCERIHNSARAHGVPSLREGVPGCPQCQRTRTG